MNRKRTKELLPVMQAFADGAEVQCTEHHECNWLHVSNPVWRNSFQYRIKPTEPREWWIYPNAVASKNKEHTSGTILVREVIE